MNLLDSETLQLLRAQLLELQAALRLADETGRETERPVELGQARVGRLSRMDALQNQALSKATGERRRSLLKGVASALKRIEHGHYGECDACGNSINPLRLKADPVALLCIDCASEVEGSR